MTDYVHDSLWYEQQANEALGESQTTPKISDVHYALQRADILSRLFMGALIREQGVPDVALVEDNWDPRRSSDGL